MHQQRVNLFTIVYRWIPFRLLKHQSSLFKSCNKFSEEVHLWQYFKRVKLLSLCRRNYQYNTRAVVESIILSCFFFSFFFSKFWCQSCMTWLTHINLNIYGQMVQVDLTLTGRAQSFLPGFIMRGKDDTLNWLQKIWF